MNRRRIWVLAAVLALTVGSGVALAGRPNIEMGAVDITSGTLSQGLIADNVGGTTGVCFKNNHHNSYHQPSFACFEQALEVSGLADLLDGNSPVTVLAPTDDAFAHLVDTVGIAAVRDFLNSPSATTAFVKSSVLQGAHNLSEFAAGMSPGSPTVAVTTIGGTSLDIAFEDAAYGKHCTEVKVGSKQAVDDQSFVCGTPLRFSDGNVLIPLGRLTVMSLSD